MKSLEKIFALHRNFLRLRDKWSEFRRQHPFELCINSRGNREKHVLPGSCKRMRRGHGPQWTTIVSHGAAHYSKGAELASGTAADAHLFWHFLPTLTQKNTWQCHSWHFKSTGSLRSPFTSPFLVLMKTKTTFLSIGRGKTMTYSYRLQQAHWRQVGQ